MKLSLGILNQFYNYLKNTVWSQTAVHLQKKSAEINMIESEMVFTQKKKKEEKEKKRKRRRKKAFY